MTRLSELLKYLKTPDTEQDILQAQRLFHGRGHAYEGLHHVTVDWLPPVLLITLFAPESIAEVDLLANKLLFFLPCCKSIQLQHRYELAGPIDIIKGEPITKLIVNEANLQFNISLGKVRNTGLFLDMKNGRDWVQAHSRNKRVLNLFAYTCGFSVAAISGGAKFVLNADMSSPALNVGRENHRLNRQSCENVAFEKINIFKSFSRFKKRGPFDLLICDPPTFQKGSVDIVRDYPKILKRLDSFMAPKSTLVLCLNAPKLGKEFLMQHMQELAPHYQLIEDLQSPEAYVEAESKGLKVLCFKAV